MFLSTAETPPAALPALFFHFFFFLPPEFVPFNQLILKMPSHGLSGSQLGDLLPARRAAPSQLMPARALSLHCHPAVPSNMSWRAVLSAHSPCW